MMIEPEARRWTRSAIALTMLIVLGATGCDNSSPSSRGDADIVESDTAADGSSDIKDAAPDTGEPISCAPDELLRCTEENSPGVERCNAAGDGVVEGSCPDRSVCRAAECVEVECIPGAARCDGLEQPQRCDEEGSGWVDQDVCEEGSRCEEGFCLNRCDLAERTNSYIGCEYWAAELENHQLDDEPPRVPPEENERRAPFAVVLANTSDSYDAHISVFTGPGEFAEAVGERTVEAVSFPGVDLETVYSEVVDGRGRRLYGPISGPIDRLILPRGSMMTLILPYRAMEYGKSMLAQKAYRVESTQPVVAYQFNPICCNYSHTNDASILLPTSVLTPNYMFMSFAVWAASSKIFPPTMTVMATEEDTQVTIKLREPKGIRPFDELIFPFDEAAQERVVGPDEQGKITLTMQPYEALNLAGAGSGPTEDLTGALIEASAPVAVFGGHSCTNIPFRTPACDHLENQLFPLETWGQRFIVAALKLRQPAEDAEGTREGTYWKFLAREDDTQINVGIDISRQAVLGPVGEGVAACHEFSISEEEIRAGKFTLQAGETCEFGTRNIFVAEATKPIMLGAFISGQNTVTSNADWGSHAGDPSFFLVPPEEQYRRDYSFLTPPTYHQSYITVTGTPGSSVLLDGERVFLEDNDYMELSARGVARAHIPLEPGPHKIEADRPFGIVVYGYDDYVSYAYTGGLDFKKLTPWR